MMRKIGLILLLLGLVACANVDDEVKEPPTPDERPPAELPEDDDALDDGGATEELSGEKSMEKTINETRGKVDSNFEVKLPDSIPISDEHYLAATVDADRLHYEVAYFETDAYTEINDAALIQKTPVMIVKGTVYDSKEEANEQIGYEPIQEGMPEIELGDDVTGYQDAGAGSTFITWHEGRWSFIMRARNDENGIMEGKELAREVVGKLSQQLLPVPHENGSGLLNASSDDADAVEANRLAWQEGNIVYEVYMADALQLVDTVTERFE